MVCTVANYEYQINWNFHLDGNIELEIKLTGVLSLYQLAQGESTGGYGTEVAPRINAHYHQHLFSLRIDPHIDGALNSVQEQHIEEDAAPSRSAENWAGNGFTAPTRILQTAGEGVRDAKADIERSWTFVNESSKHYSSGKNAGFKVMCKDMPRLYAKQDSITAIRAPFAKHHIWTVPYEDAHRYPAGKYVPQTFKAPNDSIEEWIGDGKKSIANQDIVSYITIGTTHVPRPEDFPVMPAETVRFMLKPVNFFRRNPALDVPSTNDAKSVAASAAVNGNGNGTAACCH
jgi:primary-amine oxidase